METQDQNMKFHAENLEEFRRHCNFLGNMADASRMIGRNDSYVSCIFNKNQASTILRPETFYAVKFLSLEQFRQQIENDELKARDDNSREELFSEIEQLKSQLLRLAKKIS